MKDPMEVGTAEAQMPMTAIIDTPLTVAQVKNAWNHMQEMRDAILSPSDVVKIQGKPYRLKSSYRKLAYVYNLTDTIMREEKEETADKVTWRIQVRVIAPNGRACMGIGACSSNERKFMHPDHDIYAMAHTRAKNRAISDILGLGEVSAEEMGVFEEEETEKETKFYASVTQINYAKGLADKAKVDIYKYVSEKYGLPLKSSEDGRMKCQLENLERDKMTELIDYLKSLQPGQPQKP